MLGVVVEERDMAEDDQVRSGSNFLLCKGIAQPVGLRTAVGLTIEESGKDGVCVHLVLACVEPDEGDVAHAYGKVSAEVPIARQTFLGLAVHPHALQMAVGHAAQVVVARAEQVGHLGGIVLPLNLRLEENARLCLDGLLHVAGIAVPNDARGTELGNLLNGAAEGLPLHVGVVDDAEVRLCRSTSSRKAIDMLILLVAKNLHVVAAFVGDMVGTDTIEVRGGRAEAGDAYQNDVVADVGDAIASTHYLAAVAEVGTFAYDDVAVSPVANSECHADRVFGVVLQHGGGRNERSFPGLFVIVCVRL